MRPSACAMVLGGLLATAGAGAQTIYKCQGPHGVAYQNAPCGQSHTTLGTTSYQVAPNPSPAPATASAPRVYENSRSTTYAPAVAGVRPVDRSSERAQCAAERANRTAVLAQVGFNRTIDLIRQLDERVYAACKGL